jgi:hypothetical protein
MHRIARFKHRMFRIEDRYATAIPVSYVRLKNKRNRIVTYTLGFSSRNLKPNDMHEQRSTSLCEPLLSLNSRG